MLYPLIVFGWIIFAIDRVIKDFSLIQAKVCNTGIAFGISMNQRALIALSAAILLYFFWLALNAAQKKDIVMVGSIFFIVLGAVSNFIDRIIYGCVVDYMYIIPQFIRFNIADIMIFFGGVSLVWSFYRQEEG
jgi:signal peptidase II